MRDSIVGFSTVRVSGSIPAGVLGLDSTMPVPVTNLTGASQSGSLTITLTDSSGKPITNFSESFDLNGSAGTNLNFTLPGYLSAGSYTPTGLLSINGGNGEVFTGTYVVPSAPVVLGFNSMSPFGPNGPNLMLQGPVGSNYLVEASTDFINWTPIMVFPTDISPFYFSDPTATNYSQRFYRAMLLLQTQPQLGPLSVLTNGNGTVNPDYNGALLQIGATYSVTATPGTASVFTNWMSGTSLPLTVLTNGPTLTFVMQTNLVLQANFVSTNQTATTNLVTGPSKLLSNGQFQITVNGGVLGQNYVLLASTNLMDWTPISGFVDTNPPVTIYDPDAAKYRWRFYRIAPESTAPRCSSG